MVRVIETRSHGMVVYHVYHDRTLVNTFMSREFALTAAKKLMYKLFQGIR